MVRRWTLRLLANALAFVFFTGIGIAAGCVLSAGNAIDEQLPGKRHDDEQTLGLR